MTDVHTKALSKAARAVLESEYRMSVAQLSHLATHSNVLYRADLADGRRLVLRVGHPTANTRSNLDIEVAWLESLAGDPNLNITEPVSTPDGRLVVDFEVDGESRAGVLFKWVPGEPMGEGAGTSGYRAMGKVSALLHRHGGWRPPDPEKLRRWDRTFYYPADIDPVVIEEFRYDHLFGGLRSRLWRTVDLADEFLARRWSESDPMVVHGDLHEWNVHIYMGRAWVIDFEDVMLALPSQDVATSLYAARSRPDLDDLVAAFRRGYEEIGEWPVQSRGELEVYWAARQVMLMNHAAQILPEAEARDYFGRVMPWLRTFLARLG